ncbi:MAG: nucleoside triphosphate pyrophosphohydrolase family protein [Rickettsiales bacterium]|nr:nucleoside triphosphate pyrophosphohydrolase family protein [Rickettsiales bacterium]
MLELGGTEQSIILSEYASGILETDVLDPNDISPVLQGLYGEVGGIMATAKKHAREKNAYPGHKRAAEEEFGDTLWYFASLCRRLNLPVDIIFDEAVEGGDFKKVSVASDLSIGGLAHISVPPVVGSMDDTLMRLGQVAAALLEPPQNRGKMIAFAKWQ